MNQLGQVIPDNDSLKKFSISQILNQGYMALLNNDDVIQHPLMDSVTKHFSNSSEDGVGSVVDIVNNSELDANYAATQQTDTLSKQSTNNQVIVLYNILKL